MNLKEFAKHVWPVIPIRIYNQYSKDRSEERAGDIARNDSYSHLFVVDFIIWEDHIDIFG